MKRLLSLLLCVAMLFGVLPVQDLNVMAATGYSVSYDKNAKEEEITSGSIPAGTVGLQTGAVYEVLAPQGDFMKQVDGITYYFEGWNTAADGSGVNYAPGDELTVEETDITLYARWYRVTKYAVTVITNLDNQPTDMVNINAAAEAVYVSKNAVLSDESEALKLTKVSTGTYQTMVDENATYYVFVKNRAGKFDQAHGHQVVIYNQSGSTTLQNYTVTYNTGDAKTEDWKVNYHANTAAFVDEKIPEKDGYEFIGWKTKDDKILSAGELITDKILEPIELVAQWKEKEEITVNITVNHKAKTGEIDDSAAKADVSFQLLKYENGVNQPVGEVVSLTNGVFDETTNQTTYTYVFENMAQAHYHVSTVKSGYEVTVEESENHKTLNVVYTYAPNDFDLSFAVQMAEGTPVSLYPQAVNIRVSYWDTDGTWKRVPQQDDVSEAPVTVLLDENGKGIGFLPVWETIQNEGADQGKPYVYRVEVSSYVLPNGTTVGASSENRVDYVITGSDLYKGTLAVAEGKVPDYVNNENGTALFGAFYNGATGAQSGTLTLTIQAQGHKVTFDPGVNATIQEQEMLILTEQYQYPDLNTYIPVSENENVVFAGWKIDETAAENQSGAFLNTDVAYVAKWEAPVNVSGKIEIDNTYQMGDQEIPIVEDDRVKEIVVVLEKLTNGVYNAVDSKTIAVDYTGDEIHSQADYSFVVPKDGNEYRINIIALNYETYYDNNGDEQFSADEAAFVADGANVTVVDTHMSFEPDTYNQAASVDATRINAPYRPLIALAKYYARNIDRTTEYKTVVQHETAPYGMPVSLDQSGKGIDAYSVWKWHTNGIRYEYKMELTKFYGAVEGVFTQDGMAYDPVNSPYTIHYGISSWFDTGSNGQRNYLEATLTPKTYQIHFDVNLEEGSREQIYGMQDYLTDGNTGAAYFSYEHTWSFGDTLTAFPYREGYEFAGWTSSNAGVVVNQGGYISVDPLLAQDVTLTAQWHKVEDISYTVRYLEKTTEKVLHQAKIVTDVNETLELQMSDIYVEILGYTPKEVVVESAEAVDWNEEQKITVGPKSNVKIVIYYESQSNAGSAGSAEDDVFLSKMSTLENDGTYTISMETYTTDNSVRVQMANNTPLDIVMVLDQSGSIIQSGYLDDLQDAVNNFVTEIANHGRENEVDHRIAIVGYAGDANTAPTSTNTSEYPIAGGNTKNWVNTGVFDSNGDFHPYTVTGFNYTVYNGNPEADGIYYTKSENEYLLMMHHDTYYHLITEAEAREAVLGGTKIYGYADGKFVELTRNLSGLWLYTEAGAEKLYSMKEFFTYHTDVWTHRKGLDKRQIHGYGTGRNYRSSDGHEGIYVRSETTGNNPELNVYKDALVPVSVGQYGSGSLNPGLENAKDHLGSNGGTFVQYGIEMANKIFDANPIETSEGRVRVMIMFTDGLPGTGEFNATEANAAIAKAYVTKNTHNAHSYTIGLYAGNTNSSTSDVSIYMNAVSSNYPDAKDMDDVYTPASYYLVQQGTNLNDGNVYYARTGYFSNSYHQLQYGTYRSGYRNVTGWYYVNGSNNIVGVTSDGKRDVTANNRGVVGNTSIYANSGGYKDTEFSGYYSTTESAEDLKDYFSLITQEITSKITSHIVLHEDTILRDIMGQGLELTAGTQITAYKQAGTYNAETQGIDWADELKPIATLTLTEDMWAEGASGTAASAEKTTITVAGGIEKEVPYIQVFNLTGNNTTDPQGNDYHPHTIDVTGYHFEQDYINALHPQGHKLVVKVTRVEARNNVRWDRSMMTNHERSGMWLPADSHGNRMLLLNFDQPNTLFVERAYVLDYAKPFELDGWYFDQNKGGSTAEAVHLDTVLVSEDKDDDGMNWFDPANPNLSGGLDTEYGKVTIADKKVVYTPTTMQWDGDDAFYVFGKTGNVVVTSQEANQNGNLWTRVRMIPANNVYYEDSFITDPGNGTEGFVFTGNWELDYSDTRTAGQNTEISEHLETKPHGSVHGWVDSLADDQKYSDGSAHGTGLGNDPSVGAKAEFVFTGTGVDVYTRTNHASGVVVAALSKLEEVTDENGVITETWTNQETIIMDNHAESGDYYQIPTISFKDLEYGTYKVLLIATKSSSASTGSHRFQYFLDGIRVYHPLGNDQTNASAEIKDAYGDEQNAVFTEVRDILLDYEDFNTGMSDSTDKKAGAVFIDWIREGQGTGKDEEDKGVPSYEIGTFTTYGPKNEVYLSSGQAIVLKVDAAHTYAVGLKSLNGRTVTANVSGIDKTNPQVIALAHSTDLYYKAVPDAEGYIVIENGSADSKAILSITKLKTTDMFSIPVDGGVLPVTEKQVVMAMTRFKMSMNQVQKPSVEEIFTDVNNDWYTEAVQYVYDHGFMTGIGSTSTFAPQRNVTRAQVVQILYNMENKPAVTDRSACTVLKDVNDDWYTDAVCWAYNEGIVVGNVQTKEFNPNENVTREALAVMLYKYAQYKFYNTDQTSDLAGLANAQSVSEWAAEAVKWAVGAELISGSKQPNGTFDLAPQGAATRAQMASILMRFCEADFSN